MGSHALGEAARRIGHHHTFVGPNSLQGDNLIKPIRCADFFKGRHFDHEIIVLCVRWYLTFKLSSRDLVQMMAERSIVLARTTILR